MTKRDKSRKPEETGSDNIAFSPLYGITHPHVYRQNWRGWYREDMRMLSAVLRQESPTVRECQALSSADSLA